MNKCDTCGKTEGLVYSGVDALILQVLDRIEKVCYDCANAEALTRAAREVSTDV
jgi:hypothetical protein